MFHLLIFHLLIIFVTFNTEILDLLVKVDFLVSRTCNRTIVENKNSVCRYHRCDMFLCCLRTNSLTSRLFFSKYIDRKFLWFTIFSKQRINECQVRLIFEASLWDGILSIEAHLYHPKHIRWNIVDEGEEIWIFCSKMFAWTLYCKCVCVI